MNLISKNQYGHILPGKSAYINNMAIMEATTMRSVGFLCLIQLTLTQRQYTSAVFIVIKLKSSGTRSFLTVAYSIFNPENLIHITRQYLTKFKRSLEVLVNFTSELYLAATSQHVELKAEPLQLLPVPSSLASTATSYIATFQPNSFLRQFGFIIQGVLLKWIFNSLLSKP